MIDDEVHQRVKPPRLRELFAGYRDGSVASPKAKKTSKKTKKTVTKKPPKTPAGVRKQAARSGASRKERVGAR
jgi:hypothetical protein